MCGICLAIDTDRQIALNELINNSFQSIPQLEMITEAVRETGLITSNSYDWIKKSIVKGDQHGLIHMLGSDNREKIFELALIKTNMWQNKKELTVFIKPHAFDPQLVTLIEKYSNIWAPYSGIVFRFVDHLPAEIIVEINGLSAHSSLIGRNSLTKSHLGLTTMNLGIAAFVNEEQIRRPIIHEFGHALGCIHEHQSPAASIKWNEPAVIRTYAFGGWDENMVRTNLLNRYSKGEITNSRFDPDSIMLYPIADTLTLDGFFTNWNTQLSDLDKSFMSKAYSIK